MTGISEKEVNCRRAILTRNYSVDELGFEKLILKCQTLENEKLKLLSIKQNLLILTKKNESISKDLLRLKTDYEHYKSQLHKTLFGLQLSTDKQKILFKKKLDEYLRKRECFQKYYRISPKICELEDLLSRNRHLQEEWESKSELFKLTKVQYDELKSFLMESFKKKVCEFCDVVLKLKTLL